MKNKGLTGSEQEAARISSLSEELRRVNQEIRTLLEKLPLTDFREVARMNALINDQARLMAVPVRGSLPQRILVFLDNEKSLAVSLRRRFSEAVYRGRLRAPSH